MLLLEDDDDDDDHDDHDDHDDNDDNDDDDIDAGFDNDLHRRRTCVEEEEVLLCGSQGGRAIKTDEEKDRDWGDDDVADDDDGSDDADEDEDRDHPDDEDKHIQKALPSRH